MAADHVIAHDDHFEYVDDSATDYVNVHRADYDHLVAAFDHYDERYAVYDVDYIIVRAAKQLIDHVNNDNATPKDPQ